MKFKKIGAPRVWDKNGRELFPRNGAIIPEGSILQEGNDFVTLPESQWILIDGGSDEGARLAPHYGVRNLVK